MQEMPVVPQGQIFGQAISPPSTKNKIVMACPKAEGLAVLHTSIRCPCGELLHPDQAVQKRLGEVRAAGKPTDVLLLCPACVKKRGLQDESQVV